MFVLVLSTSVAVSTLERHGCYSLEYQHCCSHPLEACLFSVCVPSLLLEPMTGLFVLVLSTSVAVSTLERPVCSRSEYYRCC